MVNYSLPNIDGLCNEMHVCFARLFKEHSDWMQPDVRIESAYGSFPHFDLNGGRSYYGTHVKQKEMEEAFSHLSEFNIFPRIVCTNQLVTKKDLNDSYTKRVLKTAAKYNGQAIVYLDEIGKAIKETYGMPLILTTNRHLKTPQEVNEACKIYDTVVFNYNYHKDESFLVQLEHPEQIEIMANEMCPINCSYRQNHSLSESKLQLANKKFKLVCQQSLKKDVILSMFTPEEVQKYSKLYKINHFKIVGRERGVIDNFNDIKNYLVLPKHMKDVENYFQQNFSDPDALNIL